MAELLARVEALLRRSRPTTDSADRFQFGAIHVDLRSTQVSRQGHPIASAMEFQLLRYFAEHRGATLSREVLLREAQVARFPSTSTRTVDVHVAWLRQKLENDPKNPELILTVVGLGYKFAA